VGMKAEAGVGAAGDGAGPGPGPGPSGPGAGEGSEASGLEAGEDADQLRPRGSGGAGHGRGGKPAGPGQAPLRTYLEYLAYLYRKLEPLSEQERFGISYRDFLQAPLQVCVPRPPRTVHPVQYSAEEMHFLQIKGRCSG